MGVVVNLIVAFVNYTLLNVWLMAIIGPLILLKIYIMFTTGRDTTINRMDGKTVIVTGANSGIGYETAYTLAARGARVILACRNLGSAHQAKANIVKLTGNENVEVKRLDLSSLWSVRQFARDILESEPRLDVLINNAGAGVIKNKKTGDDLQITWQVNHLAPFLLTHLLIGHMKKSAPSRIIFVSSMAHHFNKFDVNDMNCHNQHSSWTTYCNTKLANILTANYLAKQLKGTGVTVNSLNPGLVDTNIFRRTKNPLYKLFFSSILDAFGKTPREGSATSLTLAVDLKLSDVTGKYFADCKESKCLSSLAQDPALAEKLWKKSAQLVNLTEDEQHF